MAIAFAQVNIHSRAKGHSAVAASAYRSASRERDERTGVTYDFSHREDVVHTQLMLPEGADSRYQDKEYLWNQVESAEKRRDAQLCKDFVLALPKELDLANQIELAERFAQVHFIEKNIPVELAIHDKGDGNPHAHLLTPTRRLGPDGFSKYKARDLNPSFARGRVVEQDFWGEQWRTTQDDYFQEKSIDLRVDLNHVVAERHEGKVRGNSHYIREENAQIKQAREEIVLGSVENLLNILSLETSVFTKRDIEKLLFKSVKSPDAVKGFMGTVSEVLSNKNVIELGVNEQGQSCYTTRHQYIQEAKLLKDIAKLDSRKTHVFDTPLTVLIEKYGLNDEQQQALSYVTRGNDLSIVVGKPGTGKSYLLKPVHAHYSSHDYRVLGAALSGKVAKALQQETGIQSSTIASLSYRLSHNKLKLTNRDVLVIDEAGMVDFANMRYLLNQARQAGAKVVLAGDPAQLSPIKKGEIFKAMLDYTGFFSLDAIKRQRDELDRQASIDYSKGRVDKALNHYHQKGAIVFDEMESLIQGLVGDWSQSINSLSDTQSHVMLSFKRSSVNALNHAARQRLIKQGLLGEEEFKLSHERLDKGRDIRVNDKVQIGFSDKKLGLNGGEYAHVKKIDASGIHLVNESGKRVNIPIHLKRYLNLAEESQIAIRKGERLLLTRNNRKLGVKNGNLAAVDSVDKQAIHIRLDDGKSVSLPKTYKHFDYGYGLTVHKSQGMTVASAQVLVDSKFWHKMLGFVAMTRHKDKLKMYVDKHSIANVDELTETFSKRPTQDNVIDWPLNLAIRYGFSPDSMVGRAVNKIAGIAHTIKDKFNYVVNYEQFIKQQDRQEKALDKNARRELARLAADYVDTQKATGKLYQKTEKEAEKAGQTIPEMPAYETLYELSQKRDRQAYELVRQGGSTLPELSVAYLKPDIVKRAANRYEQYLTIKDIARQAEANPSDKPKLAERANQVDLKQSYPQIKRQSSNYNLKPKELYQRIESYQKTYRQSLIKSLMKDYPVLDDYIKAVNRRGKLTGFYGEKLDKQISKMAHEIMANKPLAKTIKTNFKKLTRSLKQSLELGQDRGIER